MIVEVAGSMAAGIMARSFALIAFGADSLVELASSYAVLRHLREDEGGSGGLGSKTAWLTSSLLFALIPIIALGAVYSYTAGIQPESSPFGIAIALGAVVIMPYLWRGKSKIGHETGCLPLSIDALESATCFLMSIALLGGLLLEFFFNLRWADYAATGIILAFVAKQALGSFHEVSRKGSG